MEPVNTLALVTGSVKRKLDEREIVEGLRGVGPQGINSADEFGWTSLHYAAFMGYDTLLAALIGFYRSLVLGEPAPEALSVVVLLAVVAGLWAIAVALMTRLEGRLDEYW